MQHPDEDFSQGWKNNVKTTTEKSDDSFPSEAQKAIL